MNIKMYHRKFNCEQNELMETSDISGSLVCFHFIKRCLNDAVRMTVPQLHRTQKKKIDSRKKPRQRGQKNVKR